MLNQSSYGSIASRLIAQIIDSFVALVPLLVLVALYSIVRGDAGASKNEGGDILGIMGVLGAAAYLLLADALPGGQSLAKRWLGLAVVDARSGAPCSLGQSLVRNLCLGVLGPLDWIFIFGERHQRLGDKLAGTIVVPRARGAVDEVRSSEADRLQ